jgi:hypothetical protein
MPKKNQGSIFSHLSNYIFFSFVPFNRWLAALFQLPDAFFQRGSQEDHMTYLNGGVVYRPHLLYGYSTKRSVFYWNWDDGHEKKNTFNLWHNWPSSSSSPSYDLWHIHGFKPMSISTISHSIKGMKEERSGGQGHPKFKSKQIKAHWTAGTDPLKDIGYAHVRMIIFERGQR